MKLHSIALDWCDSCTATNLLECCPGCGPIPCGRSPREINRLFFSVLYRSHEHSTSKNHRSLACALRHNTRLTTLYHVTQHASSSWCRSDEDTYTPHALLNYASDSLHICLVLSPAHTWKCSGPPCRIGSLTTTACLVRSKPFWCVVFI